MRRNRKDNRRHRMRKWKKRVALDKRRRLSKLWKKTAPEATVEEYRNKYQFVNCEAPVETIVVQYLPKGGGVKNPEDHVVLYAPKVPTGCPSHFFGLCRSAKKRLCSTLKVGDRLAIVGYKVTGRPKDFCKVSDDGLVQIMPKLEAKRILHMREGPETELEPAIILNVFEHRFWLEAERLQREQKREVDMKDLKPKHVMRVRFLNEELEVHHSYTPHATNVPHAVGSVIDYGPISAIKGTETLRLQRRVKRRKGLPRLILETNFMRTRLARMRMMPAGAVVGSGFIFPPSFDERRLPCTKEGQVVRCSTLSAARQAIVSFDVASPRDGGWTCLCGSFRTCAHVPGFSWMYKYFDELASESAENQRKGIQFNELKIGGAATVGQSEEHRRMVLASGRADIVTRQRHDTGYYYTFALVFDTAKVDPFDLDACQENNIKKSVASMWEKGSIFRIAEACHKRPFAEGCVLKMKCTPDKVTETILVNNKVKEIKRTIKVTLRVTADIWARDEDQHFTAHTDKLNQLLSQMTDALFMPDLDRTGFGEQIKTFGRRKLWDTFNRTSLNSVGRILRDVFCWQYTPQAVDISDTVLRRSEEQSRFDEAQLNNLKTMVASKGRACIMDAPSGTGKTDLCTEFIAESLTRDWVEYGVRQSFPVIVFKSNANLVNAIRIMTQHIRGFRPVLLSSTSARERLDDCDIPPDEFDAFSSRSILRDLEGRIKACVAREDGEFLRVYHAKHDAHPRRSYCEQKALGLLLKYYQPSAIFATSSTLEVYADVLCERTTHMVIDDGGQFDVATVLCLLCKFPKLEQVIISGDSRQLDTYLKGIPEELWKYGGHTVMGLIKKGFPIAVKMIRNYRSAPILSEALSHAAYGGSLEHAGGYPPTPEPDWRRDLLPLLPKPDVPILLVDVGGRGEFADYGTSSVNKREQKVVLELVERLRNILDDRVSIAVLSPYLGQKNEMKHLLEDYHCFVRTVDSFVGQVADVVILSTVQSWDRAEDDVAREIRRLRYNKFFTHAGRALCAISRPVHAFVMVGNMDALEVNDVYSRFLQFARRHTSVVRGDCCHVTFCPPNYALYVQAKASHPGLRGIAYNEVFGHVALLDGNLQYQVGKVYKVRIQRIDDAHNDVAQAVGARFCISVGTILDAFCEVRDEDVRKGLLDKVPWRREGPVRKPTTRQGPPVRRGRHSGRPVVSAVKDNGDRKDSKAPTDSKRDATPGTGHLYEGLVYDVQPLYVRVYVPQFGISVVALKNAIQPTVGAPLQFRLKEAEGFVARLDVPYQAIAVEEIGTVTNDELAEVHKLVNQPKEQATVAHPGPSTSSTWSSEQGPTNVQSTSRVEQEESAGLLYEGVVYEVDPSRVLVYVSCLHKTVVAFTTNTFHPPVGTLLKFRLKNSDRSAVVKAPEEMSVVDNERLLDVYKVVHSKQEFRGAQEPLQCNGKVDASPATPVTQGLVPSRSQWEPHDHLLQAGDNEPKENATKPTFAAPENWNFAATNEKATDLLGVAVAAANGTTTFYTRLGSIEIPVETQIGVWVRMDVTLTDGRIAQGDDPDRIEQLVPPPMDTRVVRKRVLLAAEVEKRPDGVGNHILGTVLESPTVVSLLPRDSTYGIFVAELEFERGCFHVIKYHKPSSSGDPATVSLEESAYPFPEDHRGLDVQQGLKEYAELLQLQHDM